MGEGSARSGKDQTSEIMKYLLEEIYIMNEKEDNKKEEKLSPKPTLNQSRRSFIKGSVAAAGAVHAP